MKKIIAILAISSIAFNADAQQGAPPVNNKINKAAVVPAVAKNNKPTLVTSSENKAGVSNKKRVVSDQVSDQEARISAIMVENKAKRKAVIDNSGLSDKEKKQLLLNIDAAEEKAIKDVRDVKSANNDNSRHR